MRLGTKKDLGAKGDDQSVFLSFLDVPGFRWIWIL